MGETAVDQGIGQVHLSLDARGKVDIGVVDRPVIDDQIRGGGQQDLEVQRVAPAGQAAKLGQAGD
ncbi:hypothetical protein O4J55_26720, partial [Paracoccus sp. PXZ]